MRISAEMIMRSEGTRLYKRLYKAKPRSWVSCTLKLRPRQTTVAARPRPKPHITGWRSNF